MKQVHIKRGRAVLLDVAAPQADSGEILVKVYASCLSVGTEMSGVRASAAPLWRRALQNPEMVAATAKKLSSEGLQTTWRAIRNKTDGASPTGYSAAGVIAEVGADIHDLAAGDPVACAGVGYAHHAEYIRVPRNLCTPIPNTLTFDLASTVTLGAIALQGVRRAVPTLGETFVVIGLGVLGQLTAQLLRVNGCRVIGTDPDTKRVDLAKKLGMEMGLAAHMHDDTDHVARLTGGLGADGVIVTAATPDDSVISAAFGMCRKKGRVVLVGDVGLNLQRRDIYAKELDFYISTSYGPGRYDNRYEEQGLDYPAPYVRWTENRNMQEYIRLLSLGCVDVSSLVSAKYPIDEADAAYASLASSTANKPLMVLLEYSQSDPARVVPPVERKVRSSRGERIRIAVVGAGAFARAVHLPNLRQLADRYEIRAVVSRNGTTAAAAASEFGAAISTSAYDSILEDSSVDAVIIATRHNLHASMALAALRAGKHVLVGKAPCTDGR